MTLAGIDPRLLNMASRIQAAKARKDFANIVRRSAKGERIKLTRYGQTLAVVVSKSDLLRLEDCERAATGDNRRR